MIKCGTCGKGFADRGRMLQHAADAHGNGLFPKKLRQPQPRAKTQSQALRRRTTRFDSPGGSGMGHLVDQGVDLLRTMSISTATTAGGKLFRIPLRPSEFTGRLHQEAAMWERWRPHKLRVEIVASGSAMTFGSMVIGWSADDSFDLNRAASDISRVVALRPSHVIRGNETASLVIPVDTSKKWYNVHGEEDCVHGTLVAVVMNPFGGFTGSFGVTAMLHWKIEFEGVALSTETVVGDVIFPDAGWDAKLFTTTDTSFSSTSLTFKESSGGNMVPFSSARAGVVYESLAGQKLYYYDSSSVQKEFSFAVRIPTDDFATPGLVFFLTYESASEFCRTGDLTKTLQYTKAGEYCAPPRPGFRARIVDSSHASTQAEDIDEEISRLQSKLSGLRARLSVEEPPRISVADASVASYAQQLRDRLYECPRGTLTDPLKVLSEDGAGGRSSVGGVNAPWERKS